MTTGRAVHPRRILGGQVLENSQILLFEDIDIVTEGMPKVRRAQLSRVDRSIVVAGDICRVRAAVGVDPDSEGAPCSPDVPRAAVDGGKRAVMNPASHHQDRETITTRKQSRAGNTFGELSGRQVFGTSHRDRP